MRTQWTANGNRDAVLLAHAIEDSTDIFGIPGGGFEHRQTPPSVRHWRIPVISDVTSCRWVLRHIPEEQFSTKLLWKPEMLLRICHDRNRCSWNILTSALGISFYTSFKSWVGCTRGTGNLWLLHASTFPLKKRPGSDALSPDASNCTHGRYTPADVYHPRFSWILLSLLINDTGWYYWVQFIL